MPKSALSLFKKIKEKYDKKTNISVLKEHSMKMQNDKRKNLLSIFSRSKERQRERDFRENYFPFQTVLTTTGADFYWWSFRDEIK
jgi:putative heme iron utilization protein